MDEDVESGSTLGEPGESSSEHDLAGGTDLNSPSPGELRQPTSQGRSTLQRDLDELDDQIEEAVERARAVGVTAAKILSTGDAAAMLLKESEAQGADLVIVGSLGRGRMARLLVGSVADKLVRTARVPVLVVR